MLVRENLQDYCRTCLKSLHTSDSTNNNTFVVADLQKIFSLLTSLAVDEENNIFPKQLCQVCYYKLLDFSNFRELVSRSDETLSNLVKGIVSEEKAVEQRRQQHEIVNSPNTSTQSIEKIKTFKHSDKNNSNNDDDDDNQLLLPELVDYAEVPSIKTERIDVVEEEADPQLNFVPCGEQIETSECIKEEVEWVYNDNFNNPLYESQDYVVNEHDTIADDADDEEHALRNGAANASTNTLRSPSAASGSSANASRKRDRNKKSYKCPRCNKSAYKKVYLEAHIRRDHEGLDKPFLCNECPKAFTRYNQLHVHIQSNHYLAEKFVCEFDGCNATFRLSNTLETHRQVKHSSGGGTTFSLELETVLDTQLNRDIESEHICPQCGKNYSSKRALSEHLKRHAQIKAHRCQVCGTAKVTRTELQTHMRTHNRELEKFGCPQCPQEFNHKNAISRHIRVVHEGQRRFTCSFCPRRFGTRNSQVCHERLHTGERPYSCEVCDKSFAQLEGLKSHMQNHDKNLRKHVCSYCSQRFITRKNLLNHESRHRSDKPHICAVCSRGFFTKGDLAIHSREHYDDYSEDEDKRSAVVEPNETIIKKKKM